MLKCPHCPKQSIDYECNLYRNFQWHISQNDDRDIILPGLTILQTIVMKAVWYQHIKKHIGQWGRIDSPEISPHIYRKLIYDKGAKEHTQWRESLLSKWCQENQAATCKSVKSDCCLIPHTKPNSK